jgi:PAS domain S-box-containing protein
MSFTNNQQSQYIRSLIEASLDPLIAISPEGKITDVNEAKVNITGVPRNKLIGSLFQNYFTDPKGARDVYKEVFAKGFISDSPLTFRSTGGVLTDVLINGSVYKDDQGKVLGVVAVARDITAQKLLSNYSLSLIEASLDPLVTISSEGKITDMNQATVNIIGLSREELIGTDFFDYFTSPENAREGYKQVFAKGFVTDYPLTIRHMNGKLTDVLFNGSVYKDDRGNVLGVVVVARDITEQKRIATELNEAKAFAELTTHIAEEAVHAKQQFLSNMSHEIRTPMNAIIGFTKVLLKTDLTAKQKEYLGAIQMSGDALIVLINDILDLAKVDAGKMTFEEIPFKLGASISAMLHLFEPKIQEKNLELVKLYDQNIPEVLIGDPVRLHQIILNLVSNAVKFTSEGKITIDIRLLHEDAEKVVIQFSVADTGIGIAENKLDNIFENFQQATSSTSRIFGGTGLGLAISKQLVEAQGGTLSVDSKLAIGSTFSFILNFRKTDAKVETELAEEVRLVAENKRIRVLVAEDIALNQLLMKTLLDDFGFEHDIAGNGKIAIAKMQDTHYDIILMDLQMPEMNGFETTHYIRKTMKSGIPIIALTADVTTADIEKCKTVGMDDYIAKPVDERALYNKMMQLLKKPAAISLESTGTESQKTERYIDLFYLSQRTKANPVLMMEMIKLYLDQTPTLIGIMKESLKKSDWTALYAAAHKIIPSFSIMGISKDFENMAKKIQEYAATQIAFAGIQEMFLKIETVCIQACKELEEEITLLKRKQTEKI